MKKSRLFKFAVLSACAIATSYLSSAQTTFSFTGGVQTYLVPSGTGSLAIDAQGGIGGRAFSLSYGHGGNGGRVQCNLAVTPGQVLYFFVGGAGDTGVSTTGGSAGGWNGGGNSGSRYAGGGGGATDVRVGGTALSNRVIVAAGGGGGGYNCSYGNDGGMGGGLVGDTGSVCGSKWYSGGCYNPLGGTQTAGGSGGTCGGGSGALGTGGVGSTFYGGGGGAGYYGGGGGYYAGGAGGSSYTDPLKVSGITLTAGYNNDTGVLVINPCLLPTVASISGPTHICVPGTITLSDATSGGVWSSVNTSVATIGSITGVVTGISAGTSTISYSVTNSCGTTAATMVVAVNSTPTISASMAGGCGNDTLVAGGGSTYSWSPTTGLSCGTCSATRVDVSGTTSYTVTGTSGGCTSAGTITVNGDRISGHISFSGITPDTLDMKVWLIQYNPIDSSVKALDSMLTCTVDSMGYYEFDGKAAGSYMVKAKMIYGSYPGASGYIPTYGLSASTWALGGTVAHTTAVTDTMHITMIYGTVPSGPGFISGNVYSGAGKGTSGETLYPGMLMYLKDATTGKILRYTYSDAMGAYSFGNIANGSYIVCGEEYQYHSIPSAVITLTTTNESVTVNFKKHLSGLYTITPYNPALTVKPVSSDVFTFFPNPVNGVVNVQWENQIPAEGVITVSDIAGRQLLRAPFSMSAATGGNAYDLSSLADGAYIIRVNAGTVNYSGKLMIQK